MTPPRSDADNEQATISRLLEIKKKFDAGQIDPETWATWSQNALEALLRCARRADKTGGVE